MGEPIADDKRSNLDAKRDAMPAKNERYRIALPLFASIRKDRNFMFDPELRSFSPIGIIIILADLRYF